jgi:hypothetical protein
MADEKQNENSECPLEGQDIVTPGPPLPNGGRLCIRHAGAGYHPAVPDGRPGAALLAILEEWAAIKHRVAKRRAAS